jgi:hypothetical protein
MFVQKWEIPAFIYLETFILDDPDVGNVENNHLRRFHAFQKNVHLACGSEITFFDKWQKTQFVVSR